MKILALIFLIASANGMILQCDFSFWNFGTIGNVYVCWATPRNVADNSTHVTGYIGTHLSGLTSDDVQLVYFHCDSRDPITIIPKGMRNIFPGFIATQNNGCPINVLNGDELNEYPQLEFFSFGFTNIDRVPGNLFFSTPHMRHAQFYNNRIMHVGDGLLDRLSNLQLADFNVEPCIHRFATNPQEIQALIAALRVMCPDRT